jgi:integrase
MGWIETRGTRDAPKYKACYRDPAGRKRSRTFTRKRAAERFLADQEIAMARGDWVDPAGAKMLLRPWVLRWMATTVDTRASTRARDESPLRHRILPRWGKTPIGGIDYIEISAWVAEMNAEGLAAETIHKYVQVLSKILQSAVAARLISHNPAQDVRLPRIDTDEMRFLTPDELHRLIDCHPAALRALPLVMGYAGLRVGEALALRPASLDPFRGEIRVSETASEVKGHLTYGPPKSKAARRTIPLPRPVVDQLEEHITTYGGERLFLGVQGGPLRLGHYRRRVWPQVVADAGLEGLRRHDLRHTAVAMWISAGADAKRIATWAGHVSTKTVLDRYGHLYRSDDQAFTDRIGAMMTDAQQRARGRGQVIELRRNPQ